MKKLGVVLQYELMTYIKNKSYVISTVVIAVIAAAIMFVPRFIDISAITGITNSTEQNSGDSDSDKDNVDGKSDSDKDNKADNNKDVILIYDESGTFSDIQIIQAAFAAMNGEYLTWDFNDPELAIVGTLLHGFEFLFIRLAPFLLTGSIIGIVFTYKKR